MQLFWLILISFVVAMFARTVKVPYALALVVAGLGIGAMHLMPEVRLDPTILLSVFLPPLLFETAINLRVDSLKRDWKPITVFALAGTILSTFVIGALCSRFLHMPIGSALVFGAAISTTDPISVLAVFARLGAGRRLRLLIEAESLFNDSVAVVLFTVALAYAAGVHQSVGGSVLEFFCLAIGGAALGIAIGGLASRLHFEIDDHLVEITLTTIVAFGSYQCAQALHLSGVMAVIASGIVIGNYGMQKAMTPNTRLAMTAWWEYAGFLVNSLVFLLIGIEVTNISWADKLPLVVGAVLIVLAGRAVIYPLSSLVNRIGADVPRSWQHILFWGGLRGALSMALILGLPRTFPYLSQIETATFGVVVFSLLVQGMTLGPLLTKLGLCSSLSGDPSDATASRIRKLNAEIVAAQAAIDEIDRLKMTESYATWSLDLLLRRYEQDMSTAVNELRQIDPRFDSNYASKNNSPQSLALFAEKIALQEAERRGLLLESDWAEIADRIDAELVRIQDGAGE